MTKILGVDASLTATGLAVNADGRFVGSDVIKPERWTRRAPQTQSERVDRLHEIVASIIYWTARADLVVVEGLAYDGHDTRRQLAGLSWLLQSRLHALELRWALIPPSSLRAFAKISPRAPKSEMLARARERFEVDVVDDNVADALWLAEVGAARLGCPVLSDSPERLSLLRGAVWPTRGLAA